MINALKIKEIVGSGEGWDVDFKRDVPSKVRELTEEACSFANSKGGIILIGVNDHNEIVGCTIDNKKRSAVQLSLSDVSPRLTYEMYSVDVDGKEVWVVEVPEGKDKPYFVAGTIYKRDGANSQKLTSADEIRDLFAQSNKVFYDEAPMPRVDIWKELDDDNLEQFRRAAGLSPDIPAEQVLENLQVLDDENVVRRGGVLFFGRAPERFFFHAVIRCVVFKGTEKILILDDKTFAGPLPKQYAKAMEWIQSKLSVAYEISGPGPRREVWEIPLSVFKEAIINALSHRDYFEQGANITIEVFDDRVEVSNPGDLLPIVARNFGRRSLSRNPLIFSLFNKMRLVEHIGSGIPRMKKDMLDAGLPEPVFETDGMFTVTFFRRKRYVFESELNGVREEMDDFSRQSVREDMNVFSRQSVREDFVPIRQDDKMQRVIKILRTEPRLTLPEIGQRIGLGRTSTYRILKELQERGWVRREGRKSDGRWRVMV
ncbi:MAG: putative DNA binding domain-containing protein [Bacteroidales bacterium]|nr:putative DNA binding domain-containing protein [Bacteroidales bacterium]